MPRPNPTLQPVSQRELAAALARTPMDLYVVWTGGAYDHRDSLRYNSLSRTVTRPGVPTPLRKVVHDAARLDGMHGYPPDKVVQGAHLHQGSRPAVYLLLRRTGSGAFVAAIDIPVADKFPHGLRAGAAVDITRIARFPPPADRAVPAMHLNAAARYIPANSAVER